MSTGSRMDERRSERGTALLFVLFLLVIARSQSGWLSASTSIVPSELWWLIAWPALAAPLQKLH